MNAVPRARLHVVAQGLHVVVEAGLVLGIQLHDPGIVIQLVEAVLERVLQRIASLRQPGRLAALGAQRHQLEEGGDGLAVFQQHGFRLRKELDPGQQFDKGRRDVIQRLLFSHGRWLAP